MLINFCLITIAYRFFGKTGLYAWTALTVILANIQVLKMTTIFGLVTAMGNIIYSTFYLSTDILSENHGRKAAQKAIWIGFFILIATTIIMQLSLYFLPHESDFAQPALNTIFGFFPRIALASIVAFLISQHTDVFVYHTIKRHLPKTRHLWIRNNSSTLVSQFVDNVLFTLIAFIGVFPFGVMVEIFITSYILKFVVAACDTPFLYLAKILRR